MNKSRLVLLGAVLAVIVFGAMACIPKPISQGAFPSLPEEVSGPFGIFFSQQQVGLWVSGEGKTMAVPDVAILSLGIEAEAKTVADAQRQAAEAMNKVMKALTDNGILEKDIQTQQFSIYPIRKWIEKQQRGEIIGYRVTNGVTAKIRKIDKAGTIIDAVAEAGGDLTRIQDINFSVDDPTPYYREAREKAVKDAVAKAKQMAEVAGVKLGKPIYISEIMAYVPPPVRLKAFAGEAPPAPAPPTPISPGELEIRLTVQMVYKID